MGKGRSFWRNVLASIVGGALLAGAGYAYRGMTIEEEFQRKTEAAITQYVEHLGDLIAEAADEDTSELRVEVRAVISTRNDLRNSIITLAELLNSDIDQLEAELTEPDISDDRRRELLHETAQVLYRKWPSKRTQIEVELRKVAAELGLVPK